MSSNQSFLFRHRTAIFAITTTATALAIIAFTTAQHEHNIRTPLRRSNAVRRSRRLEQDENEEPADRATTSSADELKGVLYYIAEEQAKRKAYQHRGIRCEECGESPIRNIRWHCLNCADFDLCSTCKALTAHQKNHVFAEIKIPVPVLAQPVGVPSWYPGNDIAIHNKLFAADRRRIAQAYEYEESEIDALADQFCCLANEAQIGGLLDAAINREAFAKALSHEKWRSRWRTNMLVERMFSFYDTEHNGKIDFEQFVSGIAYLRGKKRFASLDRAITGFDLTGDGLICRHDFIRLLRAKFEAHRLLVGEIADLEEAEHTKHIELLLHQSQPIGTVFQGDIPDGDIRDLNGKTMDRNGDMVPEHDRRVLLDEVLLRDAGDDARIDEPDKSDPPTRLNQRNSTPSSTDSLRLSEHERQILGLSTLAEQDRQHRETNEALLWAIIEESINETIDILYKPVEVRLAQVEATKNERAMWRDDIQVLIRERQDFAKRLESGSALDPLLATANQHRKATSLDDEVMSIQQALEEGMISTNPASLIEMESDLEAQSLETLLDSSGYDVQRDSEWSRPDPTLPQNRPNASSANSLPQLPSRERLDLLADIDMDEKRIHVRDGLVYLSLAEIEANARGDHSKEVEGLIKSWLAWAAF